MNGSAPVVEVRDAAVSLAGRPVLRGIDVIIREGDVVAVLGSNGSGKSTLVRTMLGLVPVTSGQVSLFGQPLAGFRDWHRVGFVPQRVTAASGVPATVREVVDTGRLSRRRRFRPRRRSDKVAVEAAIEALGLAGRAADPVSTLSGGMQQRVLIARAMAGEPELIVLDEPTAGVDLASQVAFAEALTSLVARGATIVLVAHELGPMAPMVGRSLVMDDGRICHDGTLVPSSDASQAARAGDGHHHPDLERPPAGHAPVVASPLDRVHGGEEQR